MNESILIIDDEETLCYFLKESLEEKGYKVVTSHTAREGLGMVLKQHVDLVLLDLKLPDGDGLSVLYEIRKSDSDLPVIVLTGHAAVETAVQAMKLGAYDYLEKPINLAELSSAVVQAMDSRPAGSEGVIAWPPDISSAHTVELELTDSAQVTKGGDPGWGKRAQMSRMYRRLERRIQDILAVDSISSDMQHSSELSEVIERTIHRLLQFSSVDMAAVFVADRGGRELFLANQRRFPVHLWQEAELRRVSVDGFTERIATGVGGALPLSELGPDPWVDQLNARLGNDILTLVVPLSDQDQLWGLMLIGRRGRHPFEATQIQMLCSVAQRLTLALAHAAQLTSVTERARQLAESESLHGSILQSMSNGLVVVDTEGKVRLVNRAAERMLRCRGDEVIGSFVEEVLGSGAEIVRDSLERVLVYSGEEIAGQWGGASVPLGMSVSPLRDADGKLNGVVVVLSELTEAKSSEEERRRLDRLEFLGDISAVLAHEIRNPLAGMAAGIQHLLTKFEEGDERHEAMERILKEGERVNRIIEDILLISRPPQLNLGPCDISEVVEEAVSLLGKRASEQRVEIKKHYDSDLALVRGDKMRLHQALSSLMLNGLEAMPDGGELRIAVTGPGRAEVVGSGKEAEIWREEGPVEVEIRDTRAGMKKEEIARIFEPFHTTKARGTGLGLASARRIIKEHGGEVDVLSEEGEGTKFVVRFPLVRRGGL
jgi:PAS domain S-box-containing protein